MTQEEKKGKKAKATETEVAATEAETTETTAPAPAEAEAEVDYHGGVVEILAEAGTERKKDIKLIELEERIGRNVAVRIQLGDGEDAKKFDAPRQVIIQALFENDWHRREITQLFEGFDSEVPYQIIFAATKNMENAHHQAGKTASPGVSTKRGKTFEVEVRENAESEYVKKTLGQAEYARALALGNVKGEEALSRGDIAKKLDVSYGVVYQATKELDLPDARKVEKTEGEEKPVKEKKAKAPKAEGKKSKAKTDDLPEDPEPANPDDDSEDANLMP